MTLAEVMIAMIILVFSALGLVQLTFQISKTAADNIHQNTAFAMAQGYLEQLNAMGYSTLQAIADDTTGNNVPIYLTDHSGQSTSRADGSVTLYNGGTYTEAFNLDQDTAGNGTFPMKFQFSPVLTDLSLVPGSGAQGVEITVYFTATYNLGTGPVNFTSSVRTVHANIRH